MAAEELGSCPGYGKVLPEFVAIIYKNPTTCFGKPFEITNISGSTIVNDIVNTGDH
jgi:hypothetical protein